MFTLEDCERCPSPFCFLQSRKQTNTHEWNGTQNKLNSYLLFGSLIAAFVGQPTLNSHTSSSCVDSRISFTQVTVVVLGVSAFSKEDTHLFRRRFMSLEPRTMSFVAHIITQISVEISKTLSWKTVRVSEHQAAKNQQLITCPGHPTQITVKLTFCEGPLAAFCCHLFAVAIRVQFLMIRAIFELD